MRNHKVWVPVKMKNIPEQAKILTSPWAMMKKLNGIFRAGINGRGYEKVDGIHYDGSSIHYPGASDASIRIVGILGLVAVWDSQIVDAKGAFLNGDFDNSKKCTYMSPKFKNNNTQGM